MQRLLTRTMPFLLVGLLALLSFSPAFAYHDDPNEHHEIANEHFERTWARTDKPVADDQVDRTWIWGPEPYTEELIEEYAESPGGRRTVQYFDKSRMEINDPSGDPASIWYVTNGLLVVELVTGKRQVGDAEFVQFEPAEENVAGDPDDPDTVTYADLAGVLAAPATPVGTVLTQRIDDEGNVTSDPSLADPAITAAHRVTVPGIDHTVASPFWSFMNADGIVYASGGFTTEPLFENPFYATGYPITEAYWTNVDVGGTEHLVLLQCFERRCLTYTPENAPGWQVEFGNVGQHYYRWRYAPGTTERVNIYLVQLAEPAPTTGRAFGCGDELVPVAQDVPASDTLEGDITNALNALLALDDQFYGESGLYNALWQNDADVAGVEVEGGVATVNLTGTIPSGGTCDDPRIVEQLRATAAQFPGVDEVILLLNGEPLFPSPQPEQHFRLDFGALNGSGVTGTVDLTLAGDALEISGTFAGLEAGQTHPLHIHGLDTASAVCPTFANDVNADGIIDLQEGVPAYGEVLLDIAPSPTADSEGAATVEGTYQVDLATLGPLDQRVMVIHGLTIDVDGQPQYDASVPVACGLIVEEGAVTTFRAQLDGASVVPPVDTDAAGWLVARYSGGVIAWQLTISAAIEFATDAHLHIGGPGENGDIAAILWFTEGMPFSGVGQLWSGTLTEEDLVGDVTLSELLQAFATVGVYVDVHTVANPDGEIRGQVD